MGIPDIAYAVKNPFFDETHIDAVDGWIEFKWGVAGKKIEIRPAQIRWFRHRHKVNSRPWLAWGSEKMWGLVPCHRIAGLQKGKLSGAEIMLLSDLTFRWDEDPWRKVINFALYFPTRIEDARRISADARKSGNGS